MQIQYLSVFGLVLITAGWGMQYLSMSKGNKGITKPLPALNAVGSLLLLIGAFQSGAMDIMVGNILTMLGAAVVFMAIKEK